MAFELKDRWAVVTGASAGIGKVLAGELAARGCHLVLVARRKSLLDELAQVLTGDYGIKTQVIALDLSHGNAAQMLADQLGDIPISILVNNAGFAQTGPLANADGARLRDMLQLNMVFLTSFTHVMLPRLIAFEQGARIMNVGSLAGYMGVPYMNAYAATKAFVNHFSEGLAWELSDTRVRVTSLEPGSTRTEFFDVAGMGQSFMSRFNVLSAKKVAILGVTAMIKGRRRVVCGIANRLGVFALRFSPRWMVGIVVKRLFQDLKQPK